MTLLQTAHRHYLPSGAELESPFCRSQEDLLTPAALAFVTELERSLREGRTELLKRRQLVQTHVEEGRRLVLPDPPAKTRAGGWRATAAPRDLQDRRIAIHGPAHGDFLVQALRCKGPVVTANVAEPLSRTWEHVIDAHRDLCSAVREGSGDPGRLSHHSAALAMRPRPIEMDEPGFRVDGKPVTAALFDAGLFLFHNAHTLYLRGQTPTLLIAGVQVRQEAEWWSQLLTCAETFLGLPRGTVRVLLLQDEVLGAFELDDVLWQLRERVVAVALHRAGYLASWLRLLGYASERLLPDPQHLGHGAEFLTNWRRLVVQTAHRRGIAVLGERSDAQANGLQMGPGFVTEADRKQSRLEAWNGNREAPDEPLEFVPFVREVHDVFDAGLPAPTAHLVDVPSYLERPREDEDDDEDRISTEDLLCAPQAACTKTGLTRNLELVVRWEEATLRGQDHLRIGPLYIDATEAELARRHVVQWLRLDARLDDGTTVTPDLVEKELQRVLGRIHGDLGSEAYSKSHYPRAARNAQIHFGTDLSR